MPNPEVYTGTYCRVPGEQSGQLPHPILSLTQVGIYGYIYCRVPGEQSGQLPHPILPLTQEGIYGYIL